MQCLERERKKERERERNAVKIELVSRKCEPSEHVANNKAVHNGYMLKFPVCLFVVTAGEQAR